MRTYCLFSNILMLWRLIKLVDPWTMTTCPVHQVNIIYSATCLIRTATCLPWTVLIRQVSWVDKVHKQHSRLKRLGLAVPIEQDLVSSLHKCLLWQVVLYICVTKKHGYILLIYIYGIPCLILLVWLKFYILA